MFSYGQLTHGRVAVISGNLAGAGPAAPGGALAVSGGSGGPVSSGPEACSQECDLLVLTSLLLPRHWPEGHQARTQRTDGLEKTLLWSRV